MGVFECVCVESQLVIASEQQLIVILEMPEGWRPIALPIRGTYNSYGTMEPPDEDDANIEAVVEFGRTLTYALRRIKAAEVDLEEVLDEIRADGSGATAGTHAVSFSLVEGGIYSAIVNAVAANGATAWKRFAQIGLARPDAPLAVHSTPTPRPVDATSRRLCEAILASPADEAPRRVYVDHLLEREDPRGKLLALLPVLEKKAKVEELVAIALPGSPIWGAKSKPPRAALVEFVRFLAWGTTFGPTAGEGQFFGYTAQDDDDDGATQPYCDRARERYAAMPELLAAIDINERAWRARGAEDEDDGDDDDDDDDDAN